MGFSKILVGLHLIRWSLTLWEVSHNNHWWNILFFSTNISTTNTTHILTDDVFTVFGLLCVFSSSVCQKFHHATLCCQEDVFPYSIRFCFCIMSQACCQNNEGASLTCQGFVILHVVLGQVVKVRSRGCVVMLSTSGRKSVKPCRLFKPNLLPLSLIIANKNKL